MTAKRLGLAGRSWLSMTVLALAAAAPEALSLTLTVTNLASLGPGTLRQALVDNNSLGGGHTIVFSNNLTGTITLAGELSVNAPVIIRGPGADVLAVSGNNLSRVFTVTAGPTEISGLTIRNGQVTGAAGNQMQDGQDAVGGGIWNNLNTLTLSNCVVLSNSVVGGMGGERAQGNVGRGGKAYGGGIYNMGGVLLLVDTSFAGNQAQGGAGGAAVNGDAGQGGDALGGAIYTFTGTNQITSCSFSNNVARGGDGGSSGGSGSGGIGGHGQGAGIYNQSVGIIWNSTLHAGNAVGGPGGSGGTEGANGSGYGGGLYVVSELALYSSTIASNSASGSAFDSGGGIFNASTDFLGITNSTCAGNQADSGGGLYGTATVANTIFAGNAAAIGPDAQGTIASRDFNLIQNVAGADLAGSTNHLITGQDPLLGPLQDNGGPTLTMALLPGSPAVDQGKSFGLTTDQRGAPRPFDFAGTANVPDGDGSDIGAFESGSPTLSLQLFGNAAVLTWPTYYGNFTAQSTTNLAESNSWSTAAGTPVVNLNQYVLTNAPVSSNRFFRLKSD